MAKTSRLEIRLTEDEKQHIEKEARACGMATSQYIRFKLLNNSKGGLYQNI